MKQACNAVHSNQRAGTLVVTTSSEKALLADSEHCTYAEGKCCLSTSYKRLFDGFDFVHHSRLDMNPTDSV